MHIDERTKVSLYLVGASLTALISAAVWVSSVAGKVETNTYRLDRAEAKQELMLEKLIEILQRTARIEQKLEKR